MAPAQRASFAPAAEDAARRRQRLVAEAGPFSLARPEVAAASTRWRTCAMARGTAAPCPARRPLSQESSPPVSRTIHPSAPALLRSAPALLRFPFPLLRPCIHACGTRRRKNRRRWAAQHPGGGAGACPRVGCPVSRSTECLDVWNRSPDDHPSISRLSRLSTLTSRLGHHLSTHPESPSLSLVSTPPLRNAIRSLESSPPRTTGRALRSDSAGRAVRHWRAGRAA